MAMTFKPMLPLSVLLLALAAFLAGCSAESGMFRTAGGPETPVQVWVRDLDSGKPIVGAAISAETIARDHPLSAASILGQTGPESSRARTDSEGAARVSVFEDREFRILVWAPGRATVVFGPMLLRDAAEGWIDPLLPDDGTNPRVQARLDFNTGR